MNKYSVYLFYDETDNVIYVGKTKRPMDQRMKEHFGSHGHLSADILKQVKYIKYYELFTVRDMDRAEAYLIKKYKTQLSNTKREFITKNEIEYIKNKINKQELKTYGGINKTWKNNNKKENHLKKHLWKKQSLHNLKLKEILKQINSGFVNTLKCLMSKI